jgi:hypothetical protein
MKRHGAEKISREKKFMTLPETPLGRGKGSTSAHLLPSSPTLGY